MITWWHYLLLVNLYLVLFFGFYKIFLRKETFFQLNRVYLVAGALLSFIIPVMQLDWVHALFITRQVHQTLFSAVDPGFIYQIKPVERNPVTLGQIIAIVYVTGAAILSGRLVYQLLLLKKLINGNGTRLAFSFFKKIRVDESLAGKQTIIEHEEVHIRQWHSADVLLIEAVMIINWFNPVVYFYRKAIKHVHEFIADRKAIQSGTPAAEYALLLLSQTFGTSPHQLTNNFFNHSFLKQRIKMLNQNDSNRSALLKYGLSAPLFAAMLVFSSATVNNSKIISIINKKTDQALSINTLHFKSVLLETKVNAADGKELPDVNLTTHLRAIVRNIAAANSGEPHRDTIPYDRSSKVFSSAEINPAFPGGEAAFGRFLRDNIRYPDKAMEDKVTGSVYIGFIVEKDGSLSNMKTLRNPGSGLAEEAIRVLAISPKWNPGIQNGKPVRVQYTVPVHFSMAQLNGKVGGADSVAKLSPTVVILRPAAKPPLTIVDGKIISSDSFKSIRPEDIKSITVFKGDSSMKYGESAKDGIIFIHMKDGVKP